jgi:hypothetical protein
MRDHFVGAQRHRRPLIATCRMLAEEGKPDDVIEMRVGEEDVS